MGVGERRLYGYGDLIFADRAIELTVRPQCLAEIAVEDRRTGSSLDCAADEADGLGIIAALMGNYAEQVQGIGVERIVLEYFLIERSGANQVACTVGVQGVIERGGERCLGVFRHIEIDGC